MQRRELLGVLGAGAAGLIAVAGGEARADADADKGTMDKVHENCLKACIDCAKNCDDTFYQCYLEVAQGKSNFAKALQLTSDCSAFCGLASSMIAKHSPLVTSSCHACAEACKACSAECDKFDSPVMKACVKACRYCEKTCEEMVHAMSV